MEQTTDDISAYALVLAADLRRNVELLQGDLPNEPDETRRVLTRWCIVLGVLGLECFESVVALLEAQATRGAYLLLRPLVEYHLRLRSYVREEAGPQAALRDWNDAAARLPEIANPYEPDEWDDDAQARIVTVLGDADQPERDVRRTCAALEETEEESNEYRWAQSAWLMERAFMRGEPVAVADVLAEGDGGVAVHWRSPSATPRTIFFEAVWYLLGLVDSFALVRGWAYGAVKARQDAVRLYLANKPDAPALGRRGPVTPGE